MSTSENGYGSDNTKLGFSLSPRTYVVLRTFFAVCYVFLTTVMLQLENYDVAPSPGCTFFRTVVPCAAEQTNTSHTFTENRQNTGVETQQKGGSFSICSTTTTAALYRSRAAHASGLRSSFALSFRCDSSTDAHGLCSWTQKLVFRALPQKAQRR